MAGIRTTAACLASVEADLRPKNYARGFGMLAGMIGALEIAQHSGQPDEAKAIITKASQFIRDFDDGIDLPVHGANAHRLWQMEAR
jgi:hypothetical protein